VTKSPIRKAVTSLRFAAVLFLAPVAAAAQPSLLPLPAAVPATPAAVDMKPSCDAADKPAVLSMVAHVRDALKTGSSDDGAFRREEFHGHPYVVFDMIRHAGVSVQAMTNCFPLYIAPEPEAKRAGFYIPSNHYLIGSFIFTPTLGFYGDPRAFRTQ
jgi:hypothetical protein